MLSNLSIPADVEVDGNIKTISQALIENDELTQCHLGFIEKYATLSQQAELLELAGDLDAMRDYDRRHQIFELVRLYPTRLTAKKHPGKNRLFFGNRNQTLDYLYRDEWLQHLDSGVFTRMALTFSRDQQQTIYVQHRIEQQGAEFYGWLEQGAYIYIYICGDVSHMAVDVEKAIVQVIELHGNMFRDDAHCTSSV